MGCQLGQALNAKAAYTREVRSGEAAINKALASHKEPEEGQRGLIIYTSGGLWNEDVNGIESDSCIRGNEAAAQAWFIVVALFMGWALYTLFSQLDRQGQAELKLADAQQKIAQATKQMEDLKQQVARLNDKEYIGQLATKELGMVQKGETQIQVVD